MQTRTIILHYHLFKNAGTSLDKILQDSFPGRWVTREFPPQGGNNTDMVEDWIRSEPDAVVFSSHTMLGPLPRIDGVRIISVLFLRDPIARIRSAYRFERNQQLDAPGPNLAKSTDFGGYVRTRLSRPGDRQCRNFHTHRLASMVPGPGPELDRAMQAMDQIDVIGLIEDFDGSMERLKGAVTPSYPSFNYTSVRANVSKPGISTQADDPKLTALLQQNNSDDLALLKAARSQTVVTP